MISLPLKMVMIGCPETSVRNYQPSLNDIPKERSSQNIPKWFLDPWRW